MAFCIKKINLAPDPLALYQTLPRNSQKVLLESARVSLQMGQYSILAYDPFLTFESKNGHSAISRSKQKTFLEGNPFDCLQKILERHQTQKKQTVPFLSGGAIGFVGYDAKRWIEPKLFRQPKDDLGFPDLYFLFFDQGIVIDHRHQQTWIFSKSKSGLVKLEKKVKNAKLKRKEVLGPDGILEKISPIQSSLTKDQFIQIVQKAQEYIQMGDIFQANLSQRFSFKFTKDPLLVYKKLRQVNPSSFFGLLEAKNFSLISGSPERLIKLENRLMQTRPIAGTRRRGDTKLTDQKISKELFLNEKERAEHIMLVDLERNDMGRVAEYGSVKVSEFMALENYSHVKHIVSNIQGKLRLDAAAMDALKAFFPGGTITGAPKIRSMEIIDELEPVSRGLYTGSLGYFGFDGDMDFNIIIRSLVIKNKEAHLQVGAGIVADSDPKKEYDETLYKAQAVFLAIFGPEKTKELITRLQSTH